MMCKLTLKYCMHIRDGYFLAPEVEHGYHEGKISKKFDAWIARKYNLKGLLHIG